MSRIKRWFGKLFIYKYVGVEYRKIYLIALIGVVWGILSLSLNFDKPIHLPQEFREHKSIAMWTCLPTKISAYMIALFFDLFQFIFCIAVNHFGGNDFWDGLNQFQLFHFLFNT